MYTKISTHKATKITTSVEFFHDVGTYVRTITITDSAGEETAICIFSKVPLAVYDLQFQNEISNDF